MLQLSLRLLCIVRLFSWLKVNYYELIRIYKNLKICPSAIVDNVVNYVYVYAKFGNDRL